MVKKLFQIGLLAVVIVAFIQSQAIADWWRLRNYEPSAQVVSISQRVGFSKEARRLFYLSDPQLNNKAEFNSNCPTVEHANVLGCYVTSGILNQGRIYMLAVDQAELDGVEEVTAAHELLHAAYQRLPVSERESLDGLLTADFARFASADLKRKVGLYGADSALRLNELHSFLGTETSQLSPQLEEYYSRYFEDRSRVVALYESYEETFRRIESRIARLEAELSRLKGEIQTLRGQIDAKRAELDATRRQMDEHLASGNTAAYNALVPQHNRLLEQHNALVEQHNNKVALHNSQARDLNRLALRHNDLAESLDSRQAE